MRPIISVMWRRVASHTPAIEPVASERPMRREGFFARASYFS
jgi:hypothetical protein